MPRDDVTFPPIGRHLAPDAGVGLDDNGNSPQGTMFRSNSCLSILARGCSPGVGIKLLFNRSIDSVVPGDAGDIPIDDLRDGVLVLRVVTMQLWDGYLHEIPVHFHGWARRRFRF